MEASGTVPTPLDLTDLCAQYLLGVLAQFSSELCQCTTPLIRIAPNLMPNNPANTTPALQLQLPVHLVLELDSITKILIAAFKNRGE